MQDLRGLQQTIKYSFRDETLLERALTHSSYTNEQMWDRTRSYERLEFLGDSVLSLIACNYLYRTYPDLPEGELTKMRKKVVCQGALAAYATTIDLGAYLLLGKGEALMDAELHRTRMDFISCERRYVLLVAPSRASPLWLGTGLPYVMRVGLFM